MAKKNKIQYTEKMKHRILKGLAMGNCTTHALLTRIAARDRHQLGQYLRRMLADHLVTHIRKGILDYWGIKHD